MFAIDCPRSDSWFRRRWDAVLGWTSISESAWRKRLWENDARCYRCAAAPLARGGATL
jgi:hypothetical protein